MLILMTTDAVGGVWQYSLDLASGLSARGTKTVLTVLGPGPTSTQKSEALGIRGVTPVDTHEASLAWPEYS